MDEIGSKFETLHRNSNLLLKGIIVLLCKLICNAIIGQDCGDGVNKDNVILRTENSLDIVG